MKNIFFTICLFFILSTFLYGQDTNITNNNTITIQGNVYYFRPSTTPSSPPPTQSSDFLGSGSWYGEDAAKAWASIADWVIDHCINATGPITSNRNERAYISAVHVFRGSDSNFSSLKIPNYAGFHGVDSKKQVRVDYWLVPTSGQMADGKRETRWFVF